MLDEFIRECVSECPHCGGKLVDFCMERCCSASQMFCRGCSKDHLAHRTNSLLMLFSSNTCDADNEEFIEQFVANEITLGAQKE